MMSFDYEPGEWPPEYFFQQPATPPQLKFLRACRENAMTTGHGFRLLCGAILEGYGLPDQINKGSASILIDFIKNAPRNSRREAERTAWREIC